MAYYWNTNGNVMDREIRRRDSVKFFTNLKTLAEMNGFTYKDLGGVLDINPTYIYKYISGKTVPREDAFESMKKRAADFFDTSVMDIFDGNFEIVEEEPVIAEPAVEEDKEETTTVLTEMIEAINKRKERVAQLTKEIAALEQAMALMKADDIL